jgi:hypothetical protein
MKKSTICLLLVAALALPALAEDADNDAIVAVVQRGYVEGIHLDADADKVRSGMHDSFVMFIRTEEGVNQLTRDAWIARLKPRAADAPRPNIKSKIVVLDRTADAALVKVDLFRDDKQVFTDYISLYRFKDGWKMVAKTFQRL